VGSSILKTQLLVVWYTLQPASTVTWPNLSQIESTVQIINDLCRPRKYERTTTWVDRNACPTRR
jgi:hypothetical protein